jgi:hypothetical protein
MYRRGRIKPCLFLSCLLVITGLAATAQENFPPGISVDPAIEKICKSKKGLNTFNILRYVNDTLDENPLLGFLGKLPLTPIVSTRDKDTTISFINMIVPQGFQLRFKGDSCEVEVFVSGKSCKCYKSHLSDSVLSYGAGARPASLILVLSKRKGLKAGDEVFGYIKTSGGTIYHQSNSANQASYDKWRHEYEGYFRFVLKDTFGN